MPEYIHVKCHRCGHEWQYTGKAHEKSDKPREKVYIACPRCRTSTRLFKVSPDREQ